MANLYVTFGRAIGSPPLMIASNARSAKLAIGGSPALTTIAADRIHTAVDLYAEAACWVDVGQNPAAADPGTAGGISFYMGQGERMQKVCDHGDKVSVVAAA